MSSIPPPDGRNLFGIAPAPGRKRTAQQAELDPAGDDRIVAPCLSQGAPHPAIRSGRSYQAPGYLIPSAAAHHYGQLPLMPVEWPASAALRPLREVRPARPRPPKNPASAILSQARQSPTAASALQACLSAWSRQTANRMDLNGLEGVVNEVAASHHLAEDDADWQRASRFIALSRNAFGDQVDASLRHHWWQAVRPSLMAPASPASKAAGDAIAAQVQAVRAAIEPGVPTENLTRKLLRALTQSGGQPGIAELLGRHAALDMTFGQLATLVFGSERTDPWLNNAPWATFITMADLIVGAGEDPTTNQRMLAGVLALTRREAEQLHRCMDKWCTNVSAAGRTAAQRSVLTALVQLGYPAVNVISTALAKVTQIADKERLIDAVSRFTHAGTAACAAGMLQTALGIHSREYHATQALISAFETMAGPPLENRHFYLSRIRDDDRTASWARALIHVTQQGYAGPLAVDLSLVLTFFYGHIDQGMLKFQYGYDAWAETIDQAAVFLYAVRAWNLFPLSDTSLQAAVAGGAGQTICANQGEAVSWIRDATTDIYLRLAYAQALAAVPQEDRQWCLDRAGRLATGLRMPPAVAAQAAGPLLQVVYAGAEAIALALRDFNYVTATRRGIDAGSLLVLACQIQPFVQRLTSFSPFARQEGWDQHWTDIPHEVARFLRAYARHDDGLHILGQVVDSCEAWGQNQAIGRPIGVLLNATIRAGDQVPRLMRRAHKHGVSEARVWQMLRFISRLPVNGVSARIFMAALQTDDVLTQIAACPGGPALKQLFEQVILEARIRMRDGENVHHSLRIRATDQAVAYLRRQDGGTPVDAAAQLMAMEMHMRDLAMTSPPDGVWHRTRTALARTTLQNARYVLTGPFHEGRDLSRSVLQTPEYREICALVWRAIDLYKHPSESPDATAREQTQMREDVLLGLAECVRDEDGYRVCPVGFKQRVVSVLQGDDRYPQVLVDTVNAAQLLTVIAQEFATSLGEQEPTPAQLQELIPRARELAKERFRNEPAEAEKFNEQLITWLGIDYDYVAE